MPKKKKKAKRKQSKEPRKPKAKADQVHEVKRRGFAVGRYVYDLVTFSDGTKMLILVREEPKDEPVKVARLTHG